MTKLQRFLLVALVIFLCLLTAMFLIPPRGADRLEDTPDALLLSPDGAELRRRAHNRFRDYIDRDKAHLVEIFLPDAEASPKSPSPTQESGRLRIYRPDTEIQDTPCVRLDTHNGTSTPICIYPPAVDKLMSSYINDYHTWEKEYLVAMATILQRDVTIGVLDLGCSLGVYSLYAAMMGHHVIAVDTLQSNLDLLSRSLTLGGFQERVTLVLNALSDRRERMEVAVPADGNMGGTYVRRVSGEKTNVTGRTLVDAILIDDLIPIIKTPRLFIKMDIEGSELRALHGASQLFQTLDVHYIFMEWMLHRFQSHGAEIVTFMLRNGMLPYSDVMAENFLKTDKYSTWPDNVFWIKR